MMRISALALLLPLLLLPGTAQAADRTVGIGSFDHLRVEGPFRIRVTIGSPRVTVSGDRRAIEGVAVRADGSTLTLRADRESWSEQGGRSGTDHPITIALSTPALASVIVIGAGELSVARMKGPRVDLSVSGTGAVTLAEADTDQLTATVIGSGTIALGGHAGKARLITNGPGTIDAGALAADELFVRLDGAGETRAAARFSADVVNTGLGRVIVAGNGRCTVRAPAGGPVRCGPAR